MEREELLMQIVEKQQELIKYLLGQYGRFLSDDLHIDKLKSELTSLTSQLEKTEKPNKPAESAEEIDLMQYVTNLLYYAHVEAMSMHSIDFDKWVEDQVDNLNEYFAQSHQVSQMTDRELLIRFKEYLDSVPEKGYYVTKFIIDEFLSRKIPAKDKTEQSNCIQCGKSVSKSGKLCDECNCK